MGAMSAAYLVRSIHFQHRPLLKIAAKLYALLLILSTMSFYNNEVNFAVYATTKKWVQCLLHI